jgi:RNA polymerase sigma-70 factor (ECF subfamily)
MDWLMSHFRRLERLLRRRGRTRQEAEDLIQEAFLRVKIYCDGGGEVKQPEAFLVRTVLNLARDARQLEHRELYVEQRVETLAIPDMSAAPDEVLAAEDRLKELERTLDAISPRTREVFFMHRLDGLSYAQIADHFDVSVSSIEKHIAKAMSAIGRKLMQP